MAICPATLKGCCDDICYGSGCLKLDGEPMLERCHGGCGALVAIDGSDSEDCECEPEEWDEEVIET